MRKGAPFTYQLGVQSRHGSVTYRLDSAPKGMTVTRDGLVRWEVPAVQPLLRSELFRLSRRLMPRVLLIIVVIAVATHTTVRPVGPQRGFAPMTIRMGASVGSGVCGPSSVPR